MASRRHAILLSIGALLVVYGVLISPLLFRISARRTWSRYPKMQKPVDIKLSQKGVELPDDRNCPAHFNWDNFTQLRESKNLLLIYLAPGHAVTIPKRLIPDADLDAVRQMISACVQPPKPAPANAGPNH